MTRMKTILKPERLCFGDTVGLIAPASPPPDPKAIDRAAEALEEYGFKPKLAKTSAPATASSRAVTANERRISWRCSLTKK